MTSQVEQANTEFHIYHRRLLIRRSIVDGAIQIAEPTPKRQQILTLARYLPCMIIQATPNVWHAKTQVLLGPYGDRYLQYITLMKVLCTQSKSVLTQTPAPTVPLSCISQYCSHGYPRTTSRNYDRKPTCRSSHRLLFEAHSGHLVVKIDIDTHREHHSRSLNHIIRHFFVASYGLRHIICVQTLCSAIKTVWHQASHKNSVPPAD